MDDEEWLRKTVGALLHRMGHEVELAEDGSRAIEIYTRAKKQGQPFDAILLDLTVRGGMGGMETILALRQIDPDVKAVVMSGYSEDPALQEPEVCGFKAALQKPFDTESLRSTLAQLMTDR